MDKKKNSAVGIVILFVAVLVGAFIFASRTHYRLTLWPTPAPKKAAEQEWTKLTNLITGFSLRIPTGTYGYDWLCKNPAQQEKRLPITTFFDAKKSAAIIAPEYIITDHPEQKSTQGAPNAHPCEKVVFAVDQDHAKAGFVHWWEIRNVPIKDDKELLAFIKKEYGAACGVKSLDKTAQDGVFNVVISPASLCSVKDRYVMKYSPKRQKLFYWNDGQEDNWKDAKGAGYDTTMIDSFRFEDGQ